MTMTTLQRIYQALWQRYRETTKKAHDEKGYVARLEDNLLLNVDPALIRADFEKGDGNELKKKIMAVHSSSALAANTFGPWKTDPAKLTLQGRSSFGPPALEWKASRWFNTHTPNLDVLLQSAQAVVGIESKLTEPLGKKRPIISPSYLRENFPNCDDAWWNLLEEARTWPRSQFDVAQIIKHSLGLSNTFRDSRQVHLIYLYWVPVNADDFPEYQRHAKDIEKAAACVKQSSLTFSYMTYTELWNQWLKNPDLVKHAESLRERYEVSA